MIARIFETINRGALILSAFDLMVARLYPSNFNLREKWNEAKDEFSFPDSMDGLEALRIIALREHLAGDKDVKGIRQSDVLEVKAERVIRNWNSAVEALARAIKFLRSECGVVLASLTPADTMLIPLADALWAGEASAERSKHLARWFWASTVSQTYAQGANTQAVSDAKELRAWEDSPAAVPPIVASGIPSNLEDSLRDTRRRNRMLTRGVLCLVICQDGRDWKTSERLAEIAPEKTIDAHHVFPDKYVKTSWEQEANIVANFSPLLGPSNRSLRNDVPSAVLLRTDVRNDHIWGHLVDKQAYQSDDWPGFLEARVTALTEAFRQEVEN